MTSGWLNNRSVVEQAHEIQCIAKELEHTKYALPDKFVVGCIIAKLPSSWRNFATTLMTLDIVTCVKRIWVRLKL